VKIGYIKNLDALRAFAALGVIVAHAYSVEVFPDWPLLVNVAYLGNFGVSLFFVLSGFVITRILIETYQSNSYFKSFYLRRLVRIFPLYYIGLIAYYFLPYILGISSLITPFKEQLIYYSYLQNFSRTFDWNAAGPGHYWSLAVEEHFYLLWPAMVYIALKLKPGMLLKVCLILIVSVHLLRLLMLNYGFNINVFTFTRLDQLVYGGIIAIVERKGLLIRKNMKVFVSVALTGIIFIILLEMGSDLSKEIFKYTFFGIAFSGLICLLIVLPDSNPISKILQLRLLKYLGKISYGMYVWHVLVITLVSFYFDGNVSVQFLMVTLGTILFASVSYFLLEKPFLKLKAKFSY
jgi:peptidoglycan/LPS O-acetylase OafA/YrhL